MSKFVEDHVEEAALAFDTDSGTQSVLSRWAAAPNGIATVLPLRSAVDVSDESKGTNVPTRLYISRPATLQSSARLIKAIAG